MSYEKIFVPNNLLISSYKFLGEKITEVCDASNKKNVSSLTKRSRDKDEVKQFFIENNDLTLRVNKSAKVNCSKGRYSTWECIISFPFKKEIAEINVNINSDSLCELIKNNTLVNGKCSEKVKLGFYNKQVIALTNSMPMYKRYEESQNLRDIMKYEGTKDYSLGERVKNLISTEENEKIYYLGTIYEYFDVVPRTFDGDDTIYLSITLYKVPKKKHIFITKKCSQDNSFYFVILGSKPKRICDDKNDKLSPNEINTIKGKIKAKNFTNDTNKSTYANYVNKSRYDYRGDQNYSFKEITTLVEYDLQDLRTKMKLNPNLYEKSNIYAYFYNE